MSKRERVARAIYHAAFSPKNEAEAKRQVPSPGWLWDRITPDQKEFCLRQADAAMQAMDSPP